MADTGDRDDYRAVKEQGEMDALLEVGFAGFRCSGFGDWFGRCRRFGGVGIQPDGEYRDTYI